MLSRTDQGAGAVRAETLVRRTLQCSKQAVRVAGTTEVRVKERGEEGWEPFRRQTWDHV